MQSKRTGDSVVFSVSAEYRVNNVLRKALENNSLPNSQRQMALMRPENPGPWDMFHVKQGTGMAWACFT